MPQRTRKRTVETRGLLPDFQKAINSIHPHRFDFYKSSSMSALDSYVTGWLKKATRHKYSEDLSRSTALITQQVKAWANKGRPYKYNGYWENQEVDLPGSKKEPQTAAPLQKTTRRRRRKTA